jgi:hypothetical protein
LLESAQQKAKTYSPIKMPSAQQRVIVFQQDGGARAQPTCPPRRKAAARFIFKKKPATLCNPTIINLVAKQNWSV